MAKLCDFDSFLKNIEPSSTTVSYISSVQNNLRDYLKQHKNYSERYVNSFLSGSYSKHTSIRPTKSDKKRDVDIIIVTNYAQSDDSKQVLQELLDVIKEKSVYSSAQLQHHSISITLSEVSIDVVPVIQDSDDEELYYVGDSELGTWVKTDPKGHKTWSTNTNKNNDNEYKPLVKIFKWWRRVNCPEDVRFPKGITLEKLIADNIGDSSKSTEDFFIETIANILSSYKENYADEGLVPIVDDPSEKIEGNNLLDGYTVEDFQKFINVLDEHSKLLNESGTDNDTWRKILGNEFPKTTSTKNINNYLTCAYAVHKQKPLWPIRRGEAAFITLKVTDMSGKVIEYENNGLPLDKNLLLDFKACTAVRQPFIVKWQITNTGTEAYNAQCLRGNFENSDIGSLGKREETSYSGSHSVQCFIIKRGICVARSQEYIVNIK